MWWNRLDGRHAQLAFESGDNSGVDATLIAIDRRRDSDDDPCL